MQKLILVLILFIAGTFALAQNPLETRLTVSIPSGPSKEVFAQLESLCECRFSYNPALLPPTVEGRVFADESLERILQKLLKADYQPKSRGSYIILNAPEPLQDKTNLEIRGEIVDAATGEKLTNVTVYDVKNLTATLSNDQGKYDLKTDAETSELVVAISKKDYQDTVIRVSDFASPDFSFSLRPITRPNYKIQEESTGVFKKFSSKVFKEHDRNVQLYEERLIQISFVPGVGTNGILGGKVTNNISLNMVAGNANGVKGVELSGVLSREKSDVSGFQASGVSNVVGGNMKGAQLGGVTNTVLGVVSGMQAAGVINTASEMKGTQIAGVQNTSVNRTDGLQLSGVVNYSGDLKGAQISGAWNHNSGHAKGLQLSGFFNYSKTLSGLQIGVVNIAGKVEKGFAFGLFNFVKEGFHEVEVGYGDIADIQLAFKSGVPGFYSILSAGIRPQQDGLWTYGLGMGSQVVQGEKFTLDLALSYNAVQPLTEYIVDTPINLQCDMLFGYKLPKGISINAGPALHWFYYEREATDPSAFMSSFARNPYFHKGEINPLNTSILWLGYQANIRF